jgi:hypothetical protein
MSKSYEGLQFEDALGHTPRVNDTTNYELQEEIDAFCTRFEINPAFKPHLNQLADYEVVMIADDSGSMALGSDADIEGVVTRWDELQLMCRLLVELYGMVNKKGIDIHFLNRDTVRHVKTPDNRKLKRAFDVDPCGATPLCDTLQRVLQQPRQPSKKRIVVIVTDGEPTTANGMAPEIDRLERMLRGRDTTMDFVTIVACTGSKRVISFLNEWDGAIPSLDVVDDFLSERGKVLDAQGDKFQFRYADYVVKLMLGSVDPYFDNLDVKPKKKRKSRRGCAVM